MKKKIITITAPVAVIDAINLMLITLKPQSLVTQKIVLKKMNETINICLN
jgi:hypothetical protein